MQPLKFAPWETGLKGYFGTATAIQNSSTTGLAIYGAEVHGHVLASLALNETQLLQLDNHARSTIAPAVMGNIHAFRNRLLETISNEEIQDIRQGKQAYEDTLAKLTLAFEDFETRYEQSTIFMPQNKWVDHLSQIKSRPDILHDVQTQRFLAAISINRRESWRAMEHFQTLLGSPNGHGIIDPNANLHDLFSKAVTAERQRFPVEYRYAEISIPSANISPVAVDRLRFFNAARELIRNAVFSTLVRSDEQRIIGTLRGKAEIGIRIGMGNHEMRIEINDNGIGMTPEQIQKVTDYGFSQHAENTRFGGRGIGASIAALTLEEHGGRLSYASDAQWGTTATLSIPAGTFLSQK